MISRLLFENGFSLATAQALQQWADDNLIGVEPPEEGVETPSMQILYDNIYLPNDLRPLISPYCHGQQRGGYQQDIGVNTYELVPWIEIEEGSTYGLTDSSVGCPAIFDESMSASKSVNTAVELSPYWLFRKPTGENWELQFRSVDRWEGQNNPINDAVRPGCDGTGDGCGEAWRAPYGGGCYVGKGPNNVTYYHPGTTKNPNGFDADVSTWTRQRNPGAYQHPFNYGYRPPRPSNIEHLGIVCYARLALIDSNGVDDRDLSNFVIHASIDAYLSDNSYSGDIGISRYRKVTNEWKLFSLFTGPNGQSYEDFEQICNGVVELIPTNPLDGVTPKDE